ncbi:CRISPR-associated endoribonuclease Cas2 1 [Candidatus Kuenenia stuttgartiensis]|jgi:CRISPR-associated protein Cas2|uniref:CRISPR-associated endoribonuclease Cas2 n=1 Tax=Kuenenia stuttgartiensis TaxID=174633 RepID=Q1Q3I5_KUEST|nr:MULTISPECIES: CRISPR-associated endonuclease Cas2 [Kuenenia]MBE7546925.1 CRISPR-associated endonuclease Cas2 [Planctomycetia bacterium]MBZ0191955.1 CRISPR-associated endonuclease Cas2 [Candidatus Kuenenia stuttgartiensis]MCF6151446.1 CRISPR-associated endonuclease Cas2 [Candidatus Kuenenia stuttgartiensis]MCL4727883.1 CRISPR-associated endonuclease Cas2 [Candidatus Kuenenia stuttgartiensis]MCZ7623148.1 CRISPR-associated endonuclease Cas2 [Candidatus Kuenenia sp.]
MFYLVSYDIPETRRRTKLAKILEDFGDRVQYSVFECILDEKLLGKMIKRIQEIIIAEDDSIRIYSICAGCEKRIEVMGKGKVSKIENIYVI